MQEKIIFEQSLVPIFQNKVYPTKEEAISSKSGIVKLKQSLSSGLIYNSTFDMSLMEYDENYQNEQSNSSFFLDHLDKVLHMLLEFGLKCKKVVEIGCGKGVFFDKMEKLDIDCYGFDPTYEGIHSKIFKEYFDENQNIDAEVIIMRHTLEHIPEPHKFIETIAKANNYKGMLFVEVPTFDWILEKRAFWDIFYEHCNYFTEGSLSYQFNSAKTGRIFGGQYIYLWADLSELLTETPALKAPILQDVDFNEEVSNYQDFVNSVDRLAIWGAGAKGSTFCNLLDPQREKISYVIDINPVKQNKYIAVSGHPIVSPEALKTNPATDILIMNENYFDEIALQCQNLNIKLHQL